MPCKMLVEDHERKIAVYDNVFIVNLIDWWNEPPLPMIKCNIWIFTHEPYSHVQAAIYAKCCQVFKCCLSNSILLNTLFIQILSNNLT